MRHFAVFCVAALCTFVIGFDLAYGIQHGESITKLDLFSMNFIEQEAGHYNKTINGTLAAPPPGEGVVELNQLGTNYLLLMLESSIASNIALSSMSERQTLSVYLVFSFVISTLLVPLLTGWTFGHGFLQVLYMEDQGGCLSLHLASGMAAMMACYVMKERTGRYEPISIKRNFEDEDQHIFLSTN